MGFLEEANEKIQRLRELNLSRSKGPLTKEQEAEAEAIVAEIRSDVIPNLEKLILRCKKVKAGNMRVVKDGDV